MHNIRTIVRAILLQIMVILFIIKVLLSFETVWWNLITR